MQVSIGGLACLEYYLSLRAPQGLSDTSISPCSRGLRAILGVAAVDAMILMSVGSTRQARPALASTTPHRGRSPTSFLLLWHLPRLDLGQVCASGRGHATRSRRRCAGAEGGHQAGTQVETTGAV